MAKSRSKHWTYIITSLFFAFSLSILPLPDWALWFRPAWVLMVILYWLLYGDDDVGIGIAWLAGLILDLLNGTLLAEHAFAMALVTYLALQYKNRLLYFPIWQQALWVAGLVFTYNLSIFWLQGLIGQIPNTLWYWLPILTSMVLWPWLVALLNRIRDCSGYRAY